MLPDSTKALQRGKLFSLILPPEPYNEGESSVLPAIVGSDTIFLWGIGKPKQFIYSIHTPSFSPVRTQTDLHHSSLLYFTHIGGKIIREFEQPKQTSMTQWLSRNSDQTHRFLTGIEFHSWRHLFSFHVFTAALV